MTIDVYEVGAFVMGFAWGVVALLALTIFYWQWDARHRPTSINYKDYGFDPKECETTHLPGDCPLCGGR